MGKLLQKLLDVFYYGSVRLGGTNFQDMEYAAEEWRRIDASEASEIRYLFGKLAPKEQGLCLGMLWRLRYPQLFQRTLEPEKCRQAEQASSAFFMSLKSSPSCSRSSMKSSPQHRASQASLLVTDSFDIGSEMQPRPGPRPSVHVELPTFALIPAAQPSLLAKQSPDEMEELFSESLLDSMLDIMQTAQNGLVVPASEPEPPLRLHHDVLLTQMLSEAGDDAPVEAIEKLMWKMERLSATSSTAWAAAMSLLSSTRQQEQAADCHQPIPARLIDTFDLPLPISTRG